MYQDNWVTVSQQEWPGLDHSYTVVTPRTGFGVCVIPIRFVNKKPEVLFVAQPRVPNGNILWEFPAGGVDEGEEAVHGAVRELREETGIKVSQKDLVLLGVKMELPSILEETLTIFGTVLPQNYPFETVKPEDNNEIIKLAWVDVETAYRRAAEDSSYDFANISKLFLAQRAGLFRSK